MPLRKMLYFPRRYFKRNLCIGLLITAVLISVLFLLRPEEVSAPFNFKIAPLNLPYTVVHIDLKGSPPKMAYLLSLLPLLKKYGANGLLMEYEDMFPYTGRLKAIKAENAYSSEELARFLELAAAQEFLVIPIIQTFGHLEYILKLAQFRHLREEDEFPDSICPSHNESQALIVEMLTQMIVFHSNIAPIQYLHIGFDEVYHMNLCKKCREKELSNIYLLNTHLKFVTETVHKLTPKTTILIWDDQLRGIDEDTMKRITNVEPVFWDYTPDLKIPHSDLIKYQRVFDCIWVASAYKGADGRAATLPDFRKRFQNNLNWLKLIAQYSKYNPNYKFKGIILTGWSRYSNLDPPCELLQVSLHGLILNLLLVQKSKEGLSFKGPNNNLMSYFASEYDNDTDCTESVSNELALRCDSKKLITLFAYLEKVNNEAIEYFYGNFHGLYTWEYYGPNYINLNSIHNIIGWYSRTKVFLNYIESTTKNIMTRAYEQDIIDEYISLKLFGITKKINVIFNITKSYQKRRIWPANRPVIRELENFGCKHNNKGDDILYDEFIIF